MSKVVLCCKCGADITQAMKIYPKGLAGGVYCYDCNEKWEKRNKVKRVPRRRTHRVKKGVYW